MESSSDNTNKKKKTMGRRKIEMKKIEKKSSLQVAFSKRRGGLFKKASELSVLCGCEIAILVQSPAEKMYSFGHPSADSTIRRFLTNDDNNCGGEKGCYYDSYSRLEYAEALKKIQLENNNKNNQEKGGGVWFDRSIEGMGIDDLEEYLEALQGLLRNVQNRLIEVNKNDNNSNIVEPMSDDDVNSAVMMDPGSNCASSSSSSLKGLVMVGDNHESEKSSLISSSIHNQYNSHGGSSSSSSLSMGQNKDSSERMRYNEIYAALKMELRAAPCSTSSSSSAIGGSPSSSASVMAQHDGHDPLPLPQDDESNEELNNWCHVDFDSCEF